MDSLAKIAGEIKLPKTFKKDFENMAKRKKGSDLVAFTYKKTSLPDREEKAKRLHLCGKNIIMAENPAGGNPIPISVLHCGLRLCPSCSWKRARRIFENVYNIVTATEFKDKRFIFIGLSVKNCKGENLDNEIWRLLEAWHRVTKTERSSFRRSFLGTFRALEVTYNPLKKTYHPHLHVLAAVEPGYFKKSNKNYIKQIELRKLWQDACRIEYLPQCDIRKVWGTTGKQVAEVAKYTVKFADYINRPEVVEVLDPALKRKRLIAYGGLFREVRQRLDLPDEDDIGEEFPRMTVEELLRNPYIKKIVLEWKLGAYQVSLMPPSGAPADWLEPGRLAGEALRQGFKGAV